MNISSLCAPFPSGQKLVGDSEGKFVGIISIIHLKHVIHATKVQDVLHFSLFRSCLVGSFDPEFSFFLIGRLRVKHHNESQLSC
jgi:hypothetical protein